MSVQYKLNKELAQMLKGGVIMDVTTWLQIRLLRPYIRIAARRNTIL